MDYRTTYRSFIYSHYLSEGIRITVGLTLPAIIGAYLNHEDIGITLSLGASCVIMVDNAGPIMHRRNAMMVSIAVIFISSLLTGFAVGSAWATGLLVTIFCFVFSMIGVYGARAGSIGLAALFVMVLNLSLKAEGWAIVWNAVYILCGGLWYMLLSLSLYGFRPYKVTQQALGDCIQSTADYLLWRTAFYDKAPDYDNIYSNLLDKQVAVHEKQNLVRELLFKSRNIVKESTNTGRVLLLIFLDIIDLFERVMSSQQDYQQLHRYFGHTDILEKFRNLLLQICGELNETGIAVKSGKPYLMNEKLEQALAQLKTDFETLRDQERTASNVEGFISLRNVLISLEDIVSRIQTIQQYSTYDLRESKRADREMNFEKFVTHQDIDAKVLWDNFNWKSNTFRHALRVALATAVGFILSEFLPVGHGYWILLTIILIMKPAYSITKKRNTDRLLGTIAGAGIGVFVLYVIKDRHFIFGLMIAFMIIAYSFMRTRYLVFVTFMTPYILILFYLLNPNHFRSLIGDRILDTAIGSAIAWLANTLLSPAWAYKQFDEYLQQTLSANKNYFHDVASFFVGKDVGITQYKLSRKQAYVTLANISEALNQMLAEPKRKQKNATEMHQLVVLNYMMASHTATLAAIARDRTPFAAEPGYLPIIESVIANLESGTEILKSSKEENGKESAAVAADPQMPIRLAEEDPEWLDAKSPGRFWVEESRKILADALPVGQGSSSSTPGGTKSIGEINPEFVGPEHQESAESANRQGIRSMNERVAEMVRLRKRELEMGILHSETSIRLTLVKSVNDQFNFIWRISADLLKILLQLKMICFIICMEIFIS
jgi:uncharacterized membrane protein (TIGR01666 family)